MTNTPPATSPAPSSTAPLRLGRLVRADGPEPRVVRAEEEDAVGRLLTQHEWRKRLEAQLPDVVELGRLMAARIVGDALAASDEALTHWAKQVLDEARGARQLRLVAAPADIDRLRPTLGGLELDDRELELIAAPEMEPGTLRLETELGELWADVPSALERLAEVARRHTP